MTTSGTVAWFQIGTADPDAAKKFYGDLFGWSFAPDPNSGGRYHNVSYPGVEHPSGGIVDTGGAQPNHAIFLVQVNDVAATVAAAEGLGGQPFRRLHSPRVAVKPGYPSNLSPALWVHRWWQLRRPGLGGRHPPSRTRGFHWPQIGAVHQGCSLGLVRL
jgi:predicted enzyme related to lactoylglutathione lyase